MAVHPDPVARVSAGLSALVVDDQAALDLGSGEAPDPELKRLGRYRLEASLGRGGMGEVFLAWDELLRRHVAVKRIRREVLTNERARRRFRREALAAARLNHAAIVQVYELVESDDGDALVMEYVEGRGLNELVAAGEFDLERTLGIAAEIADALAEAHGKGLVHRDLKPQNLRITPEGHAKILDFGLARFLWDGDKSGGPLTRPGALIGTFFAMSPEQARGQEVDHRSDLFSLGGLIYEMLTGRAPFRGRSAIDSLRRVVYEEPKPLGELVADVQPELLELVERLLAKDPAARPRNARIVAEVLEHLLMSSSDEEEDAGPAVLLSAGARGTVIASGKAVLPALGRFASAAPPATDAVPASATTMTDENDTAMERRRVSPTWALDEAVLEPAVARRPGPWLGIALVAGLIGLFLAVWLSMPKF